MTLWQQFLIIGLLPASFLALAVIFWWTGRSWSDRGSENDPGAGNDLEPQNGKGSARALTSRWLLVLLTAAIWSSSLMRYYLGWGIDASVPYTWRFIGAHSFSLIPLGLLLVTATRLDITAARSRIAVGVATVLWLAAVVLNPAVWPYAQPDFTLLGQAVRFFDLWAALWVSSWLLPAAMAWLFTRSAFRQLANSLYRNQVHYWWLALTLFLFGGILAFARNPSQLALQEAGVFSYLLAAVVGTLSLARRQLPDLRGQLHRLLAGLWGILSIFGLVLLLLWLTQRVPDGRRFVDSDIGLLVLGAIFTAVFLLARQLFGPPVGFPLRSQRRRSQNPAAASLFQHETENVAELSQDPAQMATFIRTVVERELSTADAWLFTSEEGAAGELILRPLPAIEVKSSPERLPADGLELMEKLEVQTVQPTEGRFAADSPFSRYLRHNHQPLVQRDLGVLSSFDRLAEDERYLLQSWRRILYMPLHAGQHLIGIVALGEKRSGDLYDQRDFERLQRVAAEVAIPLYHAQKLAGLRKNNQKLYCQNQRLIQKNEELKAQAELYGQFLQLISPELRVPITSIDASWHLVREKLEESAIRDLTAPPGSNRGQGQSLPEGLAERLNQAIVDSRWMIDNLIAIVPRLQDMTDLEMKQVQLDEVCRDVIHRMSAMAEARQVAVAFDCNNFLPAMRGDAERVSEAFRHLLHNAIKFNKIGGMVQVECGAAADELYLHITDSGVGIPGDRLNEIWNGFKRLDGGGRYGGQGLGLGLPLARTIIRAHGGRIEAESKHGAGSRFSVYLPLELRL